MHGFDDEHRYLYMYVVSGAQNGKAPAGGDSVVHVLRTDTYMYTMSTCTCTCPCTYIYVYMYDVPPRPPGAGTAWSFLGRRSPPVQGNGLHL